MAGTGRFESDVTAAISGTIWALLTHPEQLALVREGKAKWLDVFEEYARWIAPIGMSPRRVAKPWSYGGVDFEPEDRVFFMFASANREEACFAEPDRFDITRDTQKSIAFGAGPHYCAGAFASRAMVADSPCPASLRDCRACGWTNQSRCGSAAGRSVAC
jgi:hypothetical protein